MVWFVLLCLAALTLAPFINYLWRSRPRNAATTPPVPEAEQAPPAQPVEGEVQPPASFAERMRALSTVAEQKAEQTGHPRELLDIPEFNQMVALLAGPECDAQTVRQYAVGRLWTPACAAFEAMRSRPDRQEMLDFTLSQLRTFPPGTLHYLLRYLASLEARPPVGDPVTIATSWWAQHSMVIESYRDYFELRSALGDPPAFGSLAAAPDVELDEVDAFLGRIDHPMSVALKAELKAWRKARIDEKALSAYGRFWEAKPEAFLLEPAPWSEALDAMEAAILGERPRSALVTGGPRIGKSSFLRLLGVRLAGKGWRVFEASAADLMADQSYFGQLEGRIRRTVAELEAGKKVVWCVGDLQQLVQSGTHQGQSASVLDQILPAMAAGQLLILAEADPTGASRALQMRPSLRTLLQTIRLLPFDETDLALFADQVAGKLGLTRQAVIQSGARDAALHYGQQYLHALDAPGVIADILKRAAERAANAAPVGAAVVVTDAHVVAAIAQITGLPADILREDEPIDLAAVRRYFGERVMGQDPAIGVIVDRIAMLKAGLTDPGKPIGIFLFAGPTGTGKTELAKTLAAFLFGSPERLVRLDMSEFQSPETASKIVGERGMSSSGDPLVERIRKEPFSVVLLDEFEKAHSNVWDLFLQVFDDGRLTDANGHTADFRHAIIILTSNLGATSHQSSGMGFGQAKDAFTDDQVLAAIRRAFRPEFVNRIDRIVVFQPLSKLLLHRILQKELAEILGRRGLRSRDWAVEWEPSALDFLIEKGFSAELGARPLKRAIDQYLLAPLAATLVEHRFPEGDQFLFVRSDGAAIQVEFVDPDGGAEATDRTPVVVQADLSLPDLILKPVAGLGVVEFLRSRLEAQEAALAAPEWEAIKASLAEAAADPGIWTRPDRTQVFAGLNLMDRVSEAAATARRLVSRLNLRAAAPEAAIAQAALQVWLVEQGLADVRAGAPGEAVVLVEAALGGNVDPAEAEAWSRQVLGMYVAWAEKRRMQHELIAPKSGEPPVLRVSGFGAHRTLAAEAGLHVMEALGEVGGQRVTARVRVADEPETDAGRQPSHAALLARLKAQPSSRTVVRRYRVAPSPLVRDAASGQRTGQLDLVLGGDFDLLFAAPQEAAERAVSA